VINVTISRCIAAMAILAAGACTTVMNWRFSYQLGTTEWDSYTWAVFSVALDITKWLMLPFAAATWPTHKARALAAATIWMVATVYSFTAALGFAALNREATAAERRAHAELHNTLKTMQRSPRWQSSAACADATTMLSREFCAVYRAKERQLRAVPQLDDPQSALVARITGLSDEQSRLMLAVCLAVACELVSALGLFAILSTSSTPGHARPQQDANQKSQVTTVNSITSANAAAPRWRPRQN
jgi:hypothetical protein